MTTFAQALETSTILAEKVATTHAPTSALREQQALADFAAFGLFKTANVGQQLAHHFTPGLLKGLGLGVGLGVPLLAAGGAFTRDSRHQGEALIRDARNQALLTAAGVGGMQALGGLFKGSPAPAAPTPAASPAYHASGAAVPYGGGGYAAAPLGYEQYLSGEQKLAAAILVDDVLEDACSSLADPATKHAALVALVRHRGEAAALLREHLP